MSSEQGPHLWGCERPRVREGRCAATGHPPASSLRGLLPASDTLHATITFHDIEESK
jgi:hypothetical protein